MIWIIGIGGSLGAAARFIAGNFISKRTQKAFPFPIGTWVINITGSFLLGLFTQFYISNDIGEWLLLFGGAGFCGGFTTFSTFGYETITLIQSNKIKLAIIYVLSSIIVGFISAMIGFYI
ncbi:putative fluoride ion transporter CrcB 2 [Compostibacillus humi]|uniref:Fluoride-specific ion channel FluC n=1 Tax=Compostibacillus humi TaxID=1245525 RepID=A0A8J3EIZ3_9BACI|nr:fluoride efflux transporter CrcB [Compostibacillus humi]GGH70144.1 putative fluoride ion transporter CrcB 2 [Compostibacillus humi]